MTVIYIDTLFLLNALVDYLLLLAAARLAGEPLRRRRFALGAVLGGMYAVAIFLPGLSFLAHPACRIASAVLMLLVSYGGSRRLLRQGVLFVALTCAFGGGVVAIGLLGGTGLSLGHGVFYSALDLKMVLLSAAVCYGALTLVFQRIGRHSAASGELVSVRLHLGERSAALTALIDTGNTLTDPVSGRPVMVAEGREHRRALPQRPLPQVQRPVRPRRRAGPAGDRGVADPLPPAALPQRRGGPRPAVGRADRPAGTGRSEAGPSAGGPVPHPCVRRGRISGPDRTLGWKRCLR